MGGKGDLYTCAICGKEYNRGVDDEVAMAEANEYWPGLKQEDAAIVCDDCWQDVRPEENPEIYEHSVEREAFMESVCQKIIKEILYGKN